jgi:hypothetical protein
MARAETPRRRADLRMETRGVGLFIAAFGASRETRSCRRWDRRRKGLGGDGVLIAMGKDWARRRGRRHPVPCEDRVEEPPFPGFKLETFSRRVRAPGLQPRGLQATCPHVAHWLGFKLETSNLKLSYAFSRPRKVPVELAKRSVSRPIRCSIETNRLGNG